MISANPIANTVPVEDQIRTFIDEPFGVLNIDRMRVGRVSFEGLVISGQQAAHQLRHMLEIACNRTHRSRLRKDGTRYHEPLPLATPARNLSVEAADYLTDLQRRKLKQPTVEKIKRTLALLQMSCGDIEVSLIDAKHIYRLWDLLRWIPSKATSDPAFKGLLADDLITRGKAARKPSPKDATFELHRRFLVAFFGHLVRLRAIPFSPMDAFLPPKKSQITDPKRASRLFKDRDLRKIFDWSHFVPWAMKYPHRWWCPILCLYTGARINEIAQLKLADIEFDNGAWAIHIQVTADDDLVGQEIAARQGVKGDSSLRRIPLPQRVVDAGFGEFIADMHACGHNRLFPHLSAGVNRETGLPNCRYSQAVQIQFGKYLKELGFAKGVGFHAFRHTLASDLNDLGVPDADVALITGHALDSSVKILRQFYQQQGERRPDSIQRRQKEALRQYRPEVELPIYKGGQFKKVLGRGAKFYP